MYFFCGMRTLSVRDELPDSPNVYTWRSTSSASASKAQTVSLAVATRRAAALLLPHPDLTLRQSRRERGLEQGPGSLLEYALRWPSS